MYDLYGKDFLFLGSSVTEGSASHGWAIPEYFKVKYGCNVTKEAVSGTTLADVDNNSYVRRLCNNVSKVQHFDAVVCQLSTNDAAQELPLGRISEEDSQGELRGGRASSAHARTQKHQALQTAFQTTSALRRRHSSSALLAVGTAAFRPQKSS